MVIQNPNIMSDKDNVRFNIGDLTFKYEGIKGSKGKEDLEKKYLLLMSNDPEYMPVSLSALEKTETKLLSKIDEKMGVYRGEIKANFLSELDPDLMQPKITVANICELRIHIISLLASSILASVLIMIGIFAIFASSLPHPLFWIGMGVPAFGITIANLIVLLSGEKDERRE